MANAKFEYFDDESEGIMEVLLMMESLFDLKQTKPPKKSQDCGKMHLYIETKDHKKRQIGK